MERDVEGFVGDPSEEPCADPGADDDAGRTDPDRGVMA